MQITAREQEGRRPQTEAEVLGDLRESVRRAREKLEDHSLWRPCLEVLEGELEDGQPFVFRIALASSSRSNSDAPVSSS